MSKVVEVRLTGASDAVDTLAKNAGIKVTRKKDRGDGVYQAYGNAIVQPGYSMRDLLERALVALHSSGAAPEYLIEDLRKAVANL